MVEWGGIIINLVLAIVLVFFVAMTIASYGNLKQCEGNESQFCPSSVCTGLNYNPQMIVYDFSGGDGASVMPLDMYCENQDTAGNCDSNGNIKPGVQNVVVLPATLLDPINNKLHGHLFVTAENIKEAVFGENMGDNDGELRNTVADYIVNGPGAYQCRYTYPSFLVGSDAGGSECALAVRKAVGQLRNSHTEDINGVPTLMGVEEEVLRRLSFCYKYNDAPWKDICNWRMYGIRDSYLDADDPTKRCNLVDNPSTTCTLNYGHGLDDLSVFDPSSQRDRLNYAAKTIGSNWSQLSLAESTDPTVRDFNGVPRLLTYGINTKTLELEGFRMNELPQDTNTTYTYDNVENFFNFVPQADWTGDIYKSAFMCSLNDAGAVGETQYHQLYALRLLNNGQMVTTPNSAGSQQVPAVTCALKG